jgi:large subunit ribosomal protein L3
MQQEKPELLAIPAYKAGMTHVITVDDREKTPNFGKPLFNAATILAVPPITVIGVRAYKNSPKGEQVLVDVFSDRLPEKLEQKVQRYSEPQMEKNLKKMEESLPSVSRISAIVASIPRDSYLSAKEPYVFEVGINGEKSSSLQYIKGLLGKEVRVSDLFRAGEFVDTIAVTKGKGFEGPVKRFGIKRKQHKSRKSVRAVGVLSPWHPATVMFSVPRAGQHGFHQRVEGNKRILLVSKTTDGVANLHRDFPHFGKLDGDFVILKGSVGGPPKRVVILRTPVRIKKKHVQPPRILEIGNNKAGVS